MSYRTLHLSSLKSLPVDCGGRKINAPLFLVDAFNIINQNITNVGIFRTAGHTKRVKLLKRSFFGEEKIPDDVSVNDVCDAVKAFLRDLEEPILTSALQDQFLRFTSTIGREDVRTRSVLQLCRVLPPRHRETLAFLMWQLKKVSEKSQENKMTISNLAVVMSMSIFDSNTAQIRGKVQDAKMETASKAAVIELLIQHAEEICGLAKRSELLPLEKEKLLAYRGYNAASRKPRVNTVVGTGDLKQTAAVQVERVRKLSRGCDENVPDSRTHGSTGNVRKAEQRVSSRSKDLKSAVRNRLASSPSNRLILHERQEQSLNTSADSVPKDRRTRPLELHRAVSDANDRRPIETEDENRRRSIDTKSTLKRGQPNTVRSGLDKTKGKFTPKELINEIQLLSSCSVPSSAVTVEPMMEETRPDQVMLEEDEERDEFADCEFRKMVLRSLKNGPSPLFSRGIGSPCSPVRDRPSIAFIKSYNRGRVQEQAAKYENVIRQQQRRPNVEPSSLVIPKSTHVLGQKQQRSPSNASCCHS